MTSAVVAQRATARGRRSIMAFHTRRLSSYPGWPAVIRARPSRSRGVMVGGGGGHGVRLPAIGPVCKLQFTRGSQYQFPDRHGPADHLGSRRHARPAPAGRGGDPRGNPLGSVAAGGGAAADANAGHRPRCVTRGRCRGLRPAVAEGYLTSHSGGYTRVAATTNPAVAPASRATPPAVAEAVASTLATAAPTCRRSRARPGCGRSGVCSAKCPMIGSDISTARAHRSCARHWPNTSTGSGARLPAPEHGHHRRLRPGSRSAAGRAGRVAAPRRLRSRTRRPTTTRVSSLHRTGSTSSASRSVRTGCGSRPWNGSTPTP